MPRCCETTFEPPSSQHTLTVALAGNPNSGKTTLFNALTGLRQKVANYPGVTVEKKTGRCKLPPAPAGAPALPAAKAPAGGWVDVIDLPGTYSLISRSPDELVAMEVLRGLRKDTPPPDVVVCVVDASNLQRNLYLVSQLIELGRPMVIALNMMDVARRRGLDVSPDQLEEELGVPVIPVVGHKRRGVDDLKAAIARACVAPLPDFPLPQPMRDELLVVGGGLAILDSRDAAAAPLPPGEGRAVPPRAWICVDDSNRHLDRYQAVAERLLIGDRAGDVADLAASEPVASLLEGAHDRLTRLGIDPMQADVEAHYRWIETVAGKVVRAAEDAPVSTGVLGYEPPQPRNFSQRLDSVLIHKVWGLLIFAGIMASLFVTIFWLAAPIMDGIKTAVDWLGLHATAKLGEGPLKSLVTDGIFKGVGAVVVFVPQIALLFLFLSVLEDSGYLARAAFLMDRLLSKVGLHGKSFIPLLSSFACAIPGIMATRTIENRKDRLATILVAPFMSCSARLPVYTLLIGAFFAGYGPGRQALIMLALYALGIVAAAGTAWIFKRSFMKGPAAAFILELPTYKLPQLSQVGRSVWSNTRAFVTKAGTTIFVLSVILWAMSYYPRLPLSRVGRVEAGARQEFQSRPFNPYDYLPQGDARPLLTAANQQAAQEAARKAEDQSAEKAVAGAQSEYSLSGRLGHAMEPVIRPLGFDWKMGVGLVGAFAAREVFVSTMGIIYSVGDVEDDTADLANQMRSDRYPDGRPVWTPRVAVSLLVWFVLAMQCMSTVAIVRRETGGWRWPIFMILYMNALAYLASLAVFQVGRLVFNG